MGRFELGEPANLEVGVIRSLRCALCLNLSWVFILERGHTAFVNSNIRSLVGRVLVFEFFKQR